MSHQQFKKIQLSRAGIAFCLLMSLPLTICSCATNEVASGIKVSEDPASVPRATTDSAESRESNRSEAKGRSETAKDFQSKRNDVSTERGLPAQGEFETSSKLWELLSDTNGVKTYREKNPTGDIVSFRGEATLRTPIRNLVAVLNMPELRKEWVDSLSDTHTIEKRGMLERIEYVRSQVPWPFRIGILFFECSLSLDIPRIQFSSR